MRVLLVVLLAALSVALGCGETSSGPTTAEFNEKRNALKAKVADKKARKARSEVARGGKPSPKGKGKKASGATPSGFASVDKDYTYDPTGKRDPFRNFKWDRPDRIREREITGPLEQFDLSQLSLVAVVWKTGNARALVQDPSGESYIVAQGARIGKNEGTVTKISDNMVRVKETYVDFLGRETTKDIELRMRRNEGG
ncbi:MAG: pilus assembly protein PilP [Myxococcota bacterium]